MSTRSAADDDDDDDHVSQLADEEAGNQRLAAQGPRRTGRVDPDRARDIERRMAAMKVRRLAKEHECQVSGTGVCEHPMHRQKVFFTLDMLDMLGLDRTDPTYTEAEKKAWLAWLGQAGPPESWEDGA